MFDSSRSSRPAWPSTPLAALCFTGAVAALAAVAFGDTSSAAAVRRIFVDQILLSPVFWGTLAVALLLEWRFPADPAQRLISVGLLQDFVWLFIHTGLKLVAFVVGLRFVLGWYEAHVHVYDPGRFAEVPIALRVLVGIVLVDLSGWVNHWLRHRFGLTWVFHAIHHSQREMNALSESRLHIVDWLVSIVVGAAIVTALSIEPDKAVDYELVLLAFTRLYHANIRTNFGPLGLVLVSPQYHRVHHAIDPRYHHKNYAVIFTLWDRVFGTYCRQRDVYPETGIPDRDFPFESTARGFGLLFTPLRQLLHPFRQIRDRVANRA